MTPSPVNDRRRSAARQGSYTEAGTALTLITSPTLTDPDLPSNFNNATLEVRFGSYQSGDFLFINNQGVAPGQVGLQPKRQHHLQFRRRTHQHRQLHRRHGFWTGHHFQRQRNPYGRSGRAHQLRYASTSQNPTTYGTKPLPR